MSLLRFIVFFQEEDGIRDKLVTGVQTLLFRSHISITKTATVPSGGQVPIRATAMHLAGEQLSEMQVSGARRTGGMSPLYYVNQVLNLVESDLIDPSNDRITGENKKKKKKKKKKKIKNK